MKIRILTTFNTFIEVDIEPGTLDGYQEMVRNSSFMVSLEVIE